MWATLIVALISFLLSKKSGASTAQSAMVAGAAGLGTYYATTETDWGKSTLGEFNNSIADVTGIGYVDTRTGAAVTGEIVAVTDSDGKPVTDEAGNPLYQKVSAPVVLDAGGKPVKAADGSIANALIDGTSGVLKSWGGGGTAAVIGTASVAADEGGVSGFVDKYMPLLLIGGVALLLMR